MHLEPFGLSVHAFGWTGQENIIPTCRSAGNYYITYNIYMIHLLKASISSLNIMFSNSSLSELCNCSSSSFLGLCNFIHHTTFIMTHIMCFKVIGDVGYNCIVFGLVSDFLHYAVEDALCIQRTGVPKGSKLYDTLTHGYSTVHTAT